MGGKASVSANDWNEGLGWNEGFILHIGMAEIKITHSSPDERGFLNLWVRQFEAIPFKIGGLLGMGERDPEVEKITEICEMWQTNLKKGKHKHATGVSDDVGSVSTASVMLE